MKQQVIDFLKKYNMYYGQVDLQHWTDEFVRQMKAGNDGKPESLMMIPTYVYTDGEVNRNEPVIVMDAGGTNFRTAVVDFDSAGKPVIGSFSKRPMPGTQGALTAEQFFDTLAEAIEPFDRISNKVGFCFSFPTEIMPDGDGRILCFAKGVDIRGAEGRLLGEGINEALVKRGCSKKKFVILNDTVAAMLGAIAENPDGNFDSYIGFILGTGTNTCYIERCGNIRHAVVNSRSLMAINMESGCFNAFPRGAIDDEFDATTNNPDDHLFEKMVSGAYMAKLLRLTLVHAAEEGLLSDECAAKLDAVGEITMRDVDSFCEDRFGDSALAKIAVTDDDRGTIYDFVDAAYERAARLVAINLAAVAVQTGLGKSAERPICVSAEGTTFTKAALFRPKLDRYVSDFIVGKLGSHLVFVKSEDSTLVGSAVAVLLN